MDSDLTALAVALLLIAAFYTSVGQAGATGYIAVMGLASVAPLAMKTTALSLSLLVAAIGTVIFLRARRLSLRDVWPFAIFGVPFSMLGGAVMFPEALYYSVVGGVLIVSATQMSRAALRAGHAPSVAATRAPVWAAVATGAFIGFVSGSTGTGGGVFLAPVILAMNWGTPRQTAETTAVFNLMKSAAALIGAYASWSHIPAAIPCGWRRSPSAVPSGPSSAAATCRNYGCAADARSCCSCLV